MLFKKSLLLFLFVFLFSKTNAQNFEPGKVSIEELQEKAHPIDSSAVAAIVYKIGKTIFKYDYEKGFYALHECQIRIKIYKKEGLSWANFEVPYYVGYESMSDDVVKFSNACTYNLEGAEIVKTKLNSEGSFKKNVNEYWNEASITMPNVKVGSVIEFKYILKSENVVTFPAFNMQYSIPVNYCEYKTEIPEFYIYKPVAIGFVKVNTEQKYEDTFQGYDNQYRNSNTVKYKQISSIHTAESIPALKEEDYIDNIRNYTSSIKYELERTRFPDQKVKDYSITWEGVAKTIFDNKDFGQALDADIDLVTDLRFILEAQHKTDLSQLEKLGVIFKFVQQKMNWNNHYGYYVDKGIKKAYVEKTGNTAEINFILIRMLKLAGISVNPVLLSTIEHGVPVFPNRTIFNYVIAGVEIDGKQILLDATNKQTIPNVIPLNALNRFGRLIRKDGTSEEVNLMPKTTLNENTVLYVSVDEHGKIAGKCRIQKNDYPAFSFRENNKVFSRESYLEKLENSLNGIQISDYKIENVANLDKPIIESFTFVTANHCEIIGGKMFINPKLFFTNSRNPFMKEERQMPIYFGYPKQKKYQITINIPEGYLVESVPKPIKIATVENVGLFIFNILPEGKRIQISLTEEINAPLVSSDFYEVLKDFFQQMIDKQNEKIVLIKV
jgi:hypothetical protein